MGYEHRKISAEDRIKSKVKINPETGCWEWTGGLDTLGYAPISFQNYLTKAHRLSWSIANGPIPDGLHVLHKCDVRHCVNPEHLFVGTHQDNMRDRDAKGRGGVTKGAKNHNSKLNPEKAFEIRWHAAVGHKQRDLAKTYGVTQRTIAQVIHNKTWQQECHD